MRCVLTWGDAHLYIHTCVAVCCSVLQCVAVRCSALKYVAVDCSVSGRSGWRAPIIIITYTRSSVVRVVSNQEPVGRGPPLKNHPQHWSILGVVLQGGSSYSGPLTPGSWLMHHPTKNPPRGVGWPAINLRLRESRKTTDWRNRKSVWVLPLLRCRLSWFAHLQIRVSLPATTL